MIGSLVKYRSTRPSSRAGQLGIVVAVASRSVGDAYSVKVRWLEDGRALTYLVRELEVVQTS
tara:strand:+ start:1010 stop:1195 length:186 start_codon:yes stop_codon:yes gene_type:complete